MWRCICATFFTESQITVGTIKGMRRGGASLEVQMKRLLLAGVGMLSLVATSAVAADLPARMPTKAPVTYAPAYNWSGWYLGINGGYGWGGSDWTDAIGPISGKFDVNGGLIGGTLGVNWQTGAWVLGLEGDGDWADLRGSTACAVGICETRNNWLATVRGRIGYSFDRFIPYFTGGLALGDLEASTPGFPSNSETRAGWTVGAGVEWALAGAWTAKLEYLHVDLGDMSCDVIACGGAGPTKVKFDADVVRAGINYRFSGPTSLGGGYPGGY
jgi:outer membrane immunogenic protein